MKKKRSFLFPVILLCLVGISLYLFFGKSKTSAIDHADARNFKYPDTASITKIFIADKEGNKAAVERSKSGWMVNGKYPCRAEAILNLLEVIKNVEVSMPVPKEARNTVIKYLASSALKVEIYKGDELVKQYYVGHETDDSEGSYMLLTDVESGKNYEEPFACFIPGFKGFLQPRYIAKENEWRDRVVVNYIPPQMKSIQVHNYEAPADSSFSIELVNSGTFRLRNGSGKELPFDGAKMRQYLMYFQNISYEVLMTGRNKKLQDSLQAVKPFFTIDVTTTNGFKTDSYRFFRKAFTGEVNPELGVKYEYDPDRLYLNFDNGKEWALVQYFVFGKLLAGSNYFAPASSVKK